MFTMTSINTLSLHLVICVSPLFDKYYNLFDRQMFIRKKNTLTFVGHTLRLEMKKRVFSLLFFRAQWLEDLFHIIF